MARGRCTNVKKATTIDAWISPALRDVYMLEDIGGCSGTVVSRKDELGVAVAEGQCKEVMRKKGDS